MSTYNIVLTNMSKQMKEVFRLALEKHQKKHPGCKLNEKVCKYRLTKECIVKGDISNFLKTSHICKSCEAERQRMYYEKVSRAKRAAQREANKQLKKARSSRSVSFKKGTK